MLDSANRIAKNTLLLYLRSFLVLLLSLYTSRKVLEVLGVEDYGLYNVIGGIVGLLSFLNTTMAATYQRYFNYEIGRNNYAELKSLFHSSLSVQIVFAIIIIILAETLGLWFLKTKLTIPVDRFQVAIAVYHISIVSFAVSMFQAPYHALIIAYEKMGIFAFISVVDAVLKLAMVLVLPRFSGDHLVIYALMMLSIIAFCTLLYIILSRSKIGEYKFALDWDKKRFKSLLNFGTWGMVDSLSYTLKSQGINILLNLFFGPVVNAARGIAYQIMNAVNQFVASFQTSFRPQMMQLYAEGDMPSMYKLYYVSTKISFYMIWCIALPIMLNVSMILNLWLGEANVPAYTADFTILVLLTSTISAYANPTSCIAYATGNIKWFTIFVSGLNLLIVPIAYIVLNNGGNPQSALVVSLIVTVLVQLMRIIVVKNIEPSFSIRVYATKVVCPTLLVAFVSVLLPLMVKHVIPEGIWSSALVCVIAVLSVLICAFLLGLENDERQILISKLKKKKK